MSILRTVRSPADLRALDLPEVRQLAEEIREFLIREVSATGVTWGPNLGVVELTLAVHRVFNSPSDPVIFDTGHQSYVHKIVTGRRDLFDTLRQRDGLSGYPARAESPHDWTESSHASASLSYADGLSKAFGLTDQEDRTVVAVIGDGGLTGGMAWEALNNISAAHRPVVIVVNDNGVSYSPTVGGLARNLAARRDGVVSGAPGVSGAPEGLEDRALRLIRGITRGRRPGGTDGGSAGGHDNSGDGPYGAALPASGTQGSAAGGARDARELAGDLGLTYIGPVDGHDQQSIEDALRQARDFRGPVIVHTVTEKGHGYAPAVNDTVDHLHSTGVIDPATGRHAPAPRGWTDVFADELVRLGESDEDIVAVTAAMAGPTGLSRFAAEFPARTFDVGIAEQHAVTSAAGLALGGLRPIVAVYSTFLNRAFDQLLMDVALLHLPVTVVLDRAGVTGPDGPSHNGVWDLSVTGVIPGIRVAAPRDAGTLVRVLDRTLGRTQSPAGAVDAADGAAGTGGEGPGPTVIRFPRGPVPADVPVVRTTTDYDVLVETRPDVAGAGCLNVVVVSYGALTAQAASAAEALAGAGHRATVVDPVWVTPVPAGLLRLVSRADLVVTLEDNVVHGGAGQRLHRAMVDAEIDTPVRYLALPEVFPAQGSRAEVLADMHLDEVSVARRVTGWASRVHRPGRSDVTG